MNVKKITLTATTLIIASALSTGVMAQDTLSAITDKGVAFGNKKGSNVVKFFKNRNKTYAAGIYMTKKRVPGTWTATCITKKEKTLVCQYTTNEQNTGIITFDLSDRKVLKSTHLQSNKKVNGEITWHSMS